MQTQWIAGVALVAALMAGCQNKSAEATASAAEPPVKPELAAANQPVNAPSPAANPGPACANQNDVAATLSRLFDAADADGDGKISKAEASAAASFLVGGAFVRADANGDGVVTPEEGRDARTQFMQQHPQIAQLLDEVRKTTGQNPFAALAAITAIDTNQPLRLNDVRKATQSAVDQVFLVADTNHDGFITRDEARLAGLQVAGRLEQSAFQSADKNHDGKLTPDEFQQALNPAAKAVFDMADTNKDGYLSEAEAAAAAGQVAQRLGM